MAVVVPFGKGNRKTKGYVTVLSQTCDYDISKVKEIADISRSGVEIETKLIALAAWMKSNYGGTMLQSLKTVLPIKEKENIKVKKRLRLLIDRETGEKQLHYYLEKNQKEGTVIYFGCPGEEGGSGKSFMARDGVFDKLDCAITWHPSDSNQVSVGSSLANYQVIYRYYGTAAHAAACPEMGRSALDAVELMNTGVQYLREHMIQEARIHYAITNTGGYSPNVVQPYAEVLYLIRAPKNAQVKELFERVNDIAKGAALMTGTRMEMQFVKACSNLVDNTVLEEILQKNLESIEREPYTAEELDFAKRISETYGGNKLDIQELLKRYEKSKKKSVEAIFTAHKDDVLSDFIVPLMDVETGMAGSTDVGDVSWVCPTAQINTVTDAAGTPGHSWQEVAQGKSSIAHKGMLFAGKVMAGAVIDLLENQELIEEAKEELTKRVGSEGYIPPIPKDIRPMAINPKK